MTTYTAAEIERMKCKVRENRAKLQALLDTPYDLREPCIPDTTLQAIIQNYVEAYDGEYIDQFIAAQKDKFDTRPYSIINKTGE